MGDRIEDILDDALTDFEALNVSISSAAARVRAPAAAQQGQSAQAGGSRITPDATPSSNTPAPPGKKKALAFDPMRGGPKRSSCSTPASSSASASTSAPAPSSQRRGDGDPGGGLRNLAENLGSAAGGGMSGLAPELEQLAAQLSKLVAEVGDGTLDGTAPSASPSSSTPMLSSTVRALAERTQHSMDQQPGLPGLPPLPPGGLPAGGVTFGTGLNSLLPDLRGLEGAGLNQLVDSILQHLLSKDVLYEPIKEIGACYPPWLERNRTSLAPEELERFEKQYEYIQKICHTYETDPNNFSELVQLMQQMQACGDPPEEVASQMSAGIMGAIEQENGDTRDPEVPSVEELQQELNKCPVQ